YKKQTALFRNNLSSGTVSEDTSEVLSEIQKDSAGTDKRMLKLQLKSLGSVRFANTESEETSDNAMDLDVATEENGAEDYSMEPSDSIVQGPGVDLFDESATDPLLRETYNDLPLLKTYLPDYGSYPIQTMLLREGIVNQPHYKVHHRKFSCPLWGENERASGLLGNVFKYNCLGTNTFGVTASNGNKIQGLSIRPYPSPSASSGNIMSQFSHVHPDEAPLSAHLEPTFVTLRLHVAAGKKHRAVQAVLQQYIKP
ncbi:hypothetical protein K466DRAFT_570743, partial [Polyporus arcularius HHB13444]